MFRNIIYGIIYFIYIFLKIKTKLSILALNILLKRILIITILAGSLITQLRLHTMKRKFITPLYEEIEKNIGIKEILFINYYYL